MRDHRQGNDLAVVWSILRDGKPFILSGKEWKLYLKNMYERKEVDDFSVKGNQIHWTFYGKDQKTTGKYSLILVGNENEKGMITTDNCDFVNVVSCSCKIENSIDSPNVETETIELTSNLDYVAGTGGGGSYDDTAIWEALNDKVDKEEGKGLSDENFTTEEKQKLAGLENYDDSGIKKDIEDLSKKVEDLEQGGQGGSTPDLSEYLTKEEFNRASEDFATTDALEGKQDTIEDLGSIRSGAGKGATAVQPSALANYATTQQLTELSAEVGKKQDTISDLETIRSGAAKGATALQEVKTINGQSIVGSGDIEIQGGGASKEWKCVLDRRMEVGERAIIISTFDDGTPLNVQEVLVQVYIDTTSTDNRQAYVFVHSSENETESRFGAINVENKLATETAPYIYQVYLKASPAWMMAEITNGVKVATAQVTGVNLSAGDVVPPQIYKDINYIKFAPNGAVQVPPILKIFVR